MSWYRDTPEARRAYAEERALLEAAELVAESLEVRDVTRKSLAESLGIARSEISQRLNGTRNLTVRSLAAMLHELDFDLQLRVRDRHHIRPAWKACGEVAPTSRYTAAGHQIRLVRSDFAA